MSKQNENRLGLRLKHLRQLRGLTAKELAAQIGVPISTYREWEYGRAIVGEPYVAISEALEISVYELLTGENDKAHQCIEKVETLERTLADLKKQILRHFSS